MISVWVVFVFPSDRMQSVLYNNSFSDWSLISNCVTQRSVLDLVLFCFFIDSLSLSCSNTLVLVPLSIVIRFIFYILSEQLHMTIFNENGILVQWSNEFGSMVQWFPVNMRSSGSTHTQCRLSGIAYWTIVIRSSSCSSYAGLHLHVLFNNKSL